ncbi:MAG: site-specific integrase [Actinomycetota bacterium]|nr:site-specific integrase [Actinomycetota bacterium]
MSSRSEKEAARKLRDKITQSDKGIPVATESWTVEQYFGYWLDQMVKVKRPKTYQGYEGIVRRYIVPELGRRQLERLTVQDVRAMITRLQLDCRCCRDGIDAARTPDKQQCCVVNNCCCKTLSVRSVQYIHAVLRAGLQQAMREDLVMRNVAKLVQVQAPNHRVDRGLSAAEAMRLLELAKADRLHALYVLALYLGMRRAGLLGLPWEAVDLDQGVLEVRQSLQRVRGELRLVATKSRSSERPEPLPDVCVRALKAHRAKQAGELLAAGVPGCGLVFTTSVGTPIEPDNLRRSWYALRKRAGLLNMRFHDLRHSCVTLLLDLGVPPHIVMRIVGHATLDVTMGIYAHAALDEQRQALRKLEDRLSG